MQLGQLQDRNPLDDIGRPTTRAFDMRDRYAAERRFEAVRIDKKNQDLLK